MRSRVLAVFVMLGLPAAATAQVEYGVKGGLSFGNISNKGVLPGDLKTRTGGAGGLFLGYRAAIVGVDIEALYAQRGAKSSESFGDAATRLDYIDVPAYVKVTIPTPGVQPFAYAGPQLSFEVKCQTAYGTLDCPDNTGRKKTDFAGVIGAGVRIGAKSLGVTVEGRYVYGLTDLKLSTISDSESYKNRTFMLLVGIGK